MSKLPQLQPYDVHNKELESNVHPLDWKNPTPSGRYNLVVIGGGTAGLVTAAGAAGLGAKVALIERDLLGGDCLNVGCVPSKAIISAARAATAARGAGEYGVNVAGAIDVEFGAVMERMRCLRATISPHDSAARFTQLGVDVYLGNGCFESNDTIRVAGQTLKFKKAVVCTGARAAKLPIPGLEATGYLTNETVFSLTELPRRMIVIGGGPIGAELAQSFARFGTQVVLLEQSSHILSREEADAAQVVQDSLVRDGVQITLNSRVVRLELRGEEKIVIAEKDGRESEFVGDQVLVSIGRTPNVDGLGLERVGVQFDRRHGINVDERLRSTNRRVFAAGDVASKYRFTHAADFMARIVIQNALFLGRAKVSDLVIPWCTFTSPELAHVGIYPEEAESNGVALDTLTQPLHSVDRAILDSDTEGFVRVHIKRGTDRILGATVVGNHAGDLIGEITLAMKNRIGLKEIGATIHPYPTRADAIRKLGDLYNRTRLTPRLKTIVQTWLRWTR